MGFVLVGLPCWLVRVPGEDWDVEVEEMTCKFLSDLNLAKKRIVEFVDRFY